MSSAWSFLTKRLNAQPDEEPPGRVRRIAPPAAATDPLRADTPSRDGSDPLDNIGQRDELLRVRISQMADRLEDIRSLADDFSLLVKPVDAIAAELPQAKARILEAEALLAQEIETGQSLRREVDSLSSRLSATSGELSTAMGRVNRLEGLLHSQEVAAEEQRLSLREKTVLVDNLERQLQAETEQSQALILELKAQRTEALATDQALLDAERALSEAREDRARLDKENRRLQQLMEEQAVKIAGLNGRCGELDGQAEAHVQMITALEAQLANEQVSRQKSDAHHQSELASVEAERSSLMMRLETLSARLVATDEILAQVRGQLRDKDEALRLAERAMKEASTERVGLDRRVESLRVDLVRHATQLQDEQRARTELESRCDMLVKALSAKDSALESATAKAANLSDRADALTRRFEKDRLALETANRRLIEELQNEKAERTLAQGALDIARESRFLLQRQNETLKRAARGKQDPHETAHQQDGDAVTPGADKAPASNVRFFNVPDKNE